MRVLVGVWRGGLVPVLLATGAAAVGIQVVFAPKSADVVGGYDVSSGTFDASVSTGTLAGVNKFAGAADVGTVVVFAPANSNFVDVYDRTAAERKRVVCTRARGSCEGRGRASHHSRRVSLGPHAKSVLSHESLVLSERISNAKTGCDRSQLHGDSSAR
eukprot:6437993-Prymnesium_polylepis.1